MYNQNFSIFTVDSVTFGDSDDNGTGRDGIIRKTSGYKVEYETLF